MIPSIADAALALSQSIELSIVAKATAIVIAGLIAVRLASRARASVRHLLLAATFASLLALPLLLIAVPQATIDFPVAATAAASRSEAAVRPSNAVRPATVDAPTVTQRWSWPSPLTLARGIWLAGALLFLAPVPIVLWRLRRLRRTGLPWPNLQQQTHALAAERGIHWPVELMRHEHVPGPITFGVSRPVVMMPADADRWPAADLRRAIVHELEHVMRRDWVILLAARSICACYWFHPLAWVAWRKLSLEAERACDDAVVVSEERTDYAEQLVMLAQRLSATQEAPMLGMANRRDLSMRVSAVLDDRQRRGRAGLGLVAGAIGAASLVVLTIAPVRAVATVSEEQQVRSSERQELQKLLRKVRAARPRAIDRALYEAADAGDPKEVDEILVAGGNANAAIPGDGSPLIAAARSGVLPIVERLVTVGADPNMPVPGDGSPLIMAASRGHLEIVRYLLDHGADANLIVPGDESALMGAAEGGHLAVVQLLVARGADVNERIWTERGGRRDEGEWRTAVSQATKNGQKAVVAFLKSAGARE